MLHVYAIGSEMAEDMHLKFGTHALRDSANMTPKMFSKMSLARISLPHKFFSALNANSSKKVKDTNFRFGTHAQRVSHDIIPEKMFFKKGHGQGHMTP